MRIALVTPSINWVQGVPHYVAALGSALSRGNDVHFVAGAFDTPGLSGVAFHKVPTLPWGVTMVHASFVASMYLRRATGSVAPGGGFDVVHGAGYTCPFADVVTAHFCQVRERRLLRNGAPGTPRKTWRRIVRGLDNRLYGALSSFMERRYYRSLRAKVVIAISQNMKDDLIREFGISGERIVTIPNGVDTQRFHPTNRLLYRQQARRQLGLEEGDVVAIFVGNSWARKGLRTCIEAVRAIANPNLKLLVVGAGEPLSYCSPQEFRDPHRRVVFVNRLEPQIERYYAAADLLLFPSLYEPFGLVVLEALASGLPVVVSANAGVAEHITDGETGLLVYDPADPGELRAKVELLLGDAPLRRRLASQGRLLAEEFTWERIAALTVEAYHRALGAGPRADHEGPIVGLSRGGGLDAPRPAPK